VYGELADELGVPANGTTLRVALGLLSEQEEAAGRGMISVLVVRKRDRRPGPGFSKLAESLGRQFDDVGDFVDAEQERVFAAHSGA
jgi:hypothetical protein